MVSSVLVAVLVLVLAIVATVGIVACRVMQSIISVQKRRGELIRKQKQGATTKESNENEMKLVNLNFEKTVLMVVLGSGGHTAEMMTLISEVYEDLVNQRKIDTKIIYVIGKSDHHSLSKVKEMHKNMKSNESELSFMALPRAREVGQSWISSIWSSLHASVWAFVLIYKEKPSMILINGPGTSAIVAGIAFLQRNIFPLKFKGHCKIIYIESFARVEKLSLSGKLVYNFADRFLVQWEQLVKDYPLSECYGRLC